MKLMSSLCFLLFNVIAALGQLPSYRISVLTPASMGYYFLCPTGGTVLIPTILDSNGEVVYYSNRRGADFKIQRNGMMSFSNAGKFYLMDSTFTIRDSVQCVNGVTTDFHDMQIASNGNFLLMGTKDTVMDLSSYNYFNHNGTAGSATATVKYGILQELDANKNLVREWISKDHFAFSDVDSTFLGSPVTVDWTHFNSIEEDSDGNLLLSVRHFDEVTKIDRLTGNIIWRFGGKRNQFAITNEPQAIRGQHDVRRIANGNMTLLDNGGSNPLHPVRAKEYSLNETQLMADLVWSYLESPTTFSMSTGSVGRLPNGNTIINYGNTNNSNILFNVVDASGNKVFEIIFDDTLSSFRSFNYESLPWNLNRPQITCFQSGSVSYLDAGSGYASYLWSNGATTQTIAVTAADTFSVFVNYGIGFISSEKFIVANLQDPCLQNEIKAVNKNLIRMSSNPFHSAIQLQIENGLMSDATVMVRDIRGRMIRSLKVNSGTESISIPADDFAPGMYYIDIMSYSDVSTFKAFKIE